MKVMWKLFLGLAVFYAIIAVIYWQVGGEIVDAAGELGFYSPHSWWPLPVALSACTMGLGLLLGWWLTVIGIGALLISILGFTLEYEKPGAGAEH